MKTSIWKSNEHQEISFRKMTNYSDEIFVEKLRSIEFPDYLSYLREGCIPKLCW